MIPQLRVRTEFTYRRCYGPVDEVAARLAELNCPAAGIVDDTGTWGHVSWEKACAAHGIAPLFGTQLPVPQDDGRKPAAWALAEDLAAFYRFSSEAPETQEAWAAAKGVVRFAGAALTDPEAFDYIDINPRSRRRTRQALELAKRTDTPVVITSDNDYPSPDLRNRFLSWDDSSKMTPQHLLAEHEMEAFLQTLPVDGKQILFNTHEVAERLKGLKLRQAPIISVPGDIRELCLAGKRFRLEAGHIADWTDEYQARLERELALIDDKGFASYFIVVADMVNWAKQHMLVGPARGSSAGSLVCYLMRITEVDPLVHGLIFERFIDVNRSDLPDIDVDFNDQKRELVFDYLAEKYGAANVARIGSVNRLKPRSVMHHVGKKLGIPHGATFSVLNVLIEYSSGDSRYGKGLEDTLENTKPGQDFLERFPEAKLMGEIENHASHSGQHAAGIIISNEPVTEYCTVRNGIAHIDKKDAEHLNLLKIDALGLRTLGVIEDAGCVTPELLYSLKFDDPDVLQVFNDKKFSGIFQFEGAAQRRVSSQVPIVSFQQIDHVTALARPGPLGGGAFAHYVSRNAGEEPVEYRHPSMEPYLHDTFGVVLYQEQVMRIVRELGNFSWEETSTIRKAMSGRKGREFFDQRGKMFVEGAARPGLEIPADDAQGIWEEICNFGAWGMNKSHTVSYAMISYWCAYMKHHHTLAYAAACLRHAKDDEQTIEILRELRDEGVQTVAFDPDLSEESWAVKDGKLYAGFTNLIGVGPVKARNFIAKRETAGLDEKDREKLAAMKEKFTDLRPVHTAYGDIYANPQNYNINGPVREFADLKDEENAVVVAKLVEKRRLDANETVRLNKRGYALKGNTLFLDLMMVDDSVSKPVRVRIDRRDWATLGERIADRAVDGKDHFLVRGRWLEQFGMMHVKKIKCLTNKGMLA